MTHNCFCHVEICVGDMQRAREFYEGVFGWSFRPFGDNYWMFNTSDGMGGAITTWNSKCRPGRGCINYVHVEEIDEALPRIKKLGGRVMQKKTEIPHIGWSALFTDPFGNPLGLFQGNLTR